MTDRLRYVVIVQTENAQGRRRGITVDRLRALPRAVFHLGCVLVKDAL